MSEYHIIRIHVAPNQKVGWVTACHVTSQSEQRWREAKEGETFFRCISRFILSCIITMQSLVLCIKIPTDRLSLYIEE